MGLAVPARNVSLLWWLLPTRAMSRVTSARSATATLTAQDVATKVVMMAGMAMARGGTYKAVGALPLREAFTALDRVIVATRAGSLLSGWRANGKERGSFEGWVCYTRTQGASSRADLGGPASGRAGGSTGEGGALMAAMAAAEEAAARATEVRKRAS